MRNNIILAVVLVAAGVLIYFMNVDVPVADNKDDDDPSPTQTISPSPNITGNIPLPTVIGRKEKLIGNNTFIDTPRAGQSVGNPITISGRARVFENTFQYALKDNSGKVLYQDFGMTSASEAGQFGNYTVKIPVPLNAPRELWVEVYELSAKDGSLANSHAVPVILNAEGTNTVKVYLYNSKLDTNPMKDCSAVFPAERKVVATKETAYISLIELLKGASTAEKNQGYSTNLPIGTASEPVKLNSIRIDNGTAYADFGGGLEYKVGGSCRVNGIRSQIESTLKQFSSVKNVVISINGRTEDILQP